MRQSLPLILQKRIKTESVNHTPSKKSQYNLRSLKKSVQNRKYTIPTMANSKFIQNSQQDTIIVSPNNQQQLASSQKYSKKVYLFTEESSKDHTKKAPQPHSEDNGKLELRNRILKFTFNNTSMSELELFYNQHIKGQKTQKQNLSLLIGLLSQKIPLFSKIDPIISESLLKLGFIVDYQLGDTIYREGAPIRNIGIILWGGAALKKKKTKLKLQCIPGHSLGQEILFQRRDYSGKRSVRLQKGQFFTFEKSKATGNTGILYLGEKEYEWMYQEMASSGLKDHLLKFESLLLRHYIKKREIRSSFG